MRSTITLALFIITLNYCGGQHITAQDSAVVSTEQAEKVQCVLKYKPDAAAINACRTKVKEKYDLYWSAYFDGGAK